MGIFPSSEPLIECRVKTNMDGFRGRDADLTALLNLLPARRVHIFHLRADRSLAV
jgi:hypothetical protein